MDELPPELRGLNWSGLSELVREVATLERSALERKEKLLRETAHEVLRLNLAGVEPTQQLVERLAAQDVYLRKVIELEKRVVVIRRVALIDFLASEGVSVRGPRDLQRWIRTAGPQAAFLDAVTRVAASAAVREVSKRRKISDEEVVIEVYKRIQKALHVAYNHLFDGAHEDPHLALLARECFSEFEGAFLVFTEDQRLQRWPLLRFAQALLAVVLNEEEIAFARALVRHQFQQRLDSLDELNWKSVAEEMGSTSDAVRARWRRLKGRLAEVLSVVVAETLRLPRPQPEAQQRLVQIIERLYGPGVLRPKSRSRSKRDQSPSESSLSSPPRHLH